MSSAVLDSRFVIKEIEPILVTYYKDETGKTPTLSEFKQYLVSQASEKLVEVINKSGSSSVNSLTSKEAMTAINIYIRKLRVL